MNGFWNLNLSNLVTWSLIVIAFIGSRYVSEKLMSQRMENWENWREAYDKDYREWRKAHEFDARQRDNLIASANTAITRLATIAEVSSKRLDILEQQRREK